MSAYKEQTKGQKVSLSFSKWAESHLWDILERYEIWKNHMPMLELVAVTNDGILIRDMKLDRTAILTVKKMDLYCDIDNTSNCIHIGYAWSIPRVYQVMKEKGRKLPEIKEKPPPKSPS